jgi:tight adherence protein C
MNDILSDHPSAISTLLALVVGVSVALLVWLFSRAVTDVPQEDRAYKDPPPLGFRLLWWPVQWLSFFIDSWMPGKSKSALLLRLRQAGLDYGLNPVQFMAGRLIFALLAGMLGWWLHGMLSRTGTPVASLQLAVLGAVAGWFLPALWLKDKVDVRKRELLKSLPFFLDLITLCVEAGLNFQAGLTQSVAKGPEGPLRDEFQRVLRDLRAGKGRAASLRDMGERVSEPAVTSFVTSVIQAEIMGMNMGPILRTQADQRRVERFLRAEKLAMQAPVKMLLPLVAFIFPCTFIVLFFPIAMKFMHSGL